MNRKATWWIADVVKKKEMKRHNFSEGIIDLLRNTSMHCYSRLVELNRGFWEKLMWFIFHVLAFATLFILLSHTWDEFTTQPLVTILHDPLYPTSKIAFPAVSICSNNRISKEFATQYANKLITFDPDRRPLDYFMNNIKKFSNLYNYDLTNPEHSLEFQRFLDSYDLNETELFFNTRRRMEELTPKCSDLLLKCSLSGEQIPCMSDEMFKVKPTRHGFCCVFNADEMDSIKVVKEKRLENQFSGPEMGLTVVLNASIDDEYYTLFDLNGFIIHIYDSSVYDDASSGGITERFIFQGVESFLAVTPKVIESEEEIRRYHPKTRNCLFKNEYPEKYGDTYSFSNCITRCRMRSIRVLCRCLPFFMPKSQMDFNEDEIHCTLQHVQCLDRYRFKWTNVITVRKYVEGLEKEMEDGLYCPECLPPCSDTQYRTTLMSLPVDRFQSNGSTLLNDIPNITDVAILHVYFAEQTAKFYKQMVKNPWFEVFSTIGGICGVVTGFSLGAVCEILYFILNEIGWALKEASKRDRQKKKNKQPQLIICP